MKFSFERSIMPQSHAARGGLGREMTIKEFLIDEEPSSFNEGVLQLRSTAMQKIMQQAVLKMPSIWAESTFVIGF